MDDFTKAYIECALWAENDEDGNPLDNWAKIKDLAPETLKEMEADCAKFQKENAELLKAAYEKYIISDGSTPETYAGHDLYLSRNHAGAGFFDRDLGEIGDKLQEAAYKMGECNLEAVKGRIFII